MASGLVVVGPDRGGTAELLAEAESPFVFRLGRPGRFCARGDGRDRGRSGPSSSGGAGRRPPLRNLGRRDRPTDGVLRRSIRKQSHWPRRGRGRAGRRVQTAGPPSGGPAPGRRHAGPTMDSDSNRRAFAASTEERTERGLECRPCSCSLHPRRNAVSSGSAEACRSPVREMGDRKNPVPVGPQLSRRPSRRSRCHLSAWCHKKRPFEVEWCQHGYFHVVTKHAASVERLEHHQGLVAAGGHPVGSPLADEGEFAASFARVAPRPVDPGPRDLPPHPAIATRPVLSRRNGWAIGTSSNS